MLRRFGQLLGGQKDAAPSGQGMTAMTFGLTRPDAVLQVVGEQYHGSDVKGAAAAHLSGAVRLNAALVPQPTNQYDPNAIAVVLPGADGGYTYHVGYLARADAAAYRPVLDMIRPRAIVCPAAIEYGRPVPDVELNLGTPAELIAELWTDDRPLRTDHRWVGKTVVFTGESACRLGAVRLDKYAQQLLARLAGCEIAPRITKATDLCVACAGDTTGNAKKARNYAISVLAEADFWQEIGLEVEGRWGTVRPPGLAPAPAERPTPVPVPAEQPTLTADPASQLLILKKALDDGLISQADFDGKKAELLARM